MAKLKAIVAFDMQNLIPDGGTVRGGDGEATLRDGVWRMEFAGKFRHDDGVFSGGLSEAILFRRGERVFELTEIGRGARPAFNALDAHDGDRFLTLVLSGDDTIAGSRGGDNLFGLGGADRIGGGAGDDTINGGSGRDILSGGRGDDFLIGGLDDDRLIGGKGDDRYLIDTAFDTIVEKRNGGNDMIIASVDARIAPNVEQLLLVGEGRLTARGDGDDNRLLGNSAANALFGGGGRDSLTGNGGGDTLEGGRGVDTLTGGAGGDVFRFDKSREANHDVVTDFGGRDRIDLSRIDADETRRGDQAFDFIGRKGFTEDAGELRFRGGLLSGDTDGDGRADFRVAIDDVRTLHEDAFLL